MAKIRIASPTLFPILNAGPISSPDPSSSVNTVQTLPGPLARTAAAAPLDSTGCLTEYRPLASRSILSKVTSKRGFPFTHGINPYRGCEFGCRYCYARYTHEFMEMRNPEDFERKIFFKPSAGWLLAQELRRLKPGTEIAIGTATDPYQPIERKQGVTRSLLQAFAQESGFSLGIVTKSNLVVRDLDLLTQIAGRNKLTVHITVTTMNTRLARVLEPRAPRPDLRIAAVAELRQAGLRAGILCSPIMPGINDSRSSIAAVAKAAAGAGACFLAAGALFLKPCSKPTFMGFVRDHFPGHLAAYEQRYGSKAFVSPEYRQRLAALVDSIRREYRLGARFRREMAPDEAEDRNSASVELQPWLPFC